MISPVLASPCEAGKEEIVKAENIINELRVGDTDVIDYSNCIVVGDLNLFTLSEKAETGKHLFRLNSSHKKYLKNGSVSNTTRQAFGNNKVSLSSKANITKEDAKKWMIEDGDRIYIINDIDTYLNISTGVIDITRPLKFNKTVFKGRISTLNRSIRSKNRPPVKFLSNINFVGARFEDEVIFRDAIFEECANFDRAHFDKIVTFEDATFKGSARFLSTQFNDRARFDKTNFRYKTNFAYATFNSLAFFRKTKFLYPKRDVWGANFLFTLFKGDAIFSKAFFRCKARFRLTSFRGPTYFSESTFKDEALFHGGTRFNDDVTFTGAQFRTNYSINLTPQGESPSTPVSVFFSGVEFSQDATFSNVTFGNVDFSRAHDEGDTGMDTVLEEKQISAELHLKLLICSG
jgi:hypothetical protein